MPPSELTHAVITSPGMRIAVGIAVDHGIGSLLAEVVAGSTLLAMSVVREPPGRCGASSRRQRGGNPQGLPVGGAVLEIL